MAGSLRDQLLKAGLTTEKKAQKAAKSSKKSRELKREAKAAVEQKTAEQKAKDTALNLQIKAEAEQKAITAQVRQLIQVNRVEERGNLSYHFDDAGKVSTLTVDATLQKQLANGQLAVAKLDKDYAIIPAGVAQRIEQRRSDVIVSRHEVTEVDEDDPYKDYVIPDDLMW